MKYFISSKQQELENERETAMRTLMSMGIEQGNIFFFEKHPAVDQPARIVALTNLTSPGVLILILWKDYSEIVETEYDEAIKKDIPVLVFIRNLYDEFKEKRERKLDAFIKKIRRKMKYAEFRDLGELESQLKKSVIHILHERFEKRFPVHTRQGLYDWSNQVMSSTVKKRVVYYVKSLIFITPLNDIQFKMDHHAIMSKLVGKAKRGEVEFRCGYLVDSTKEEILDKKDAAVKISKLFKGSRYDDAKNGKFILSSSANDIQWPFFFAVADNFFVIWFTDPLDSGTYRAVWDEDERIATTLEHIFDQICAEKNLNQLLTELDLSNLK